MLFSSPVFFLFFAAYFLLHLVVPKRFRIYLIIAGSTVFYAWWRPEYAWIPYLLMATAFGGALWMGQADSRGRRKRRVLCTIAALFLPLLFFKYTNFIYRDVIGPFIGNHDKLMDLPLPLGVSFITFTLTAYVVDAFKGKFAVSRSASTVLGYVLFFPHLIAGPILRPADLIPQLERPKPAALRRAAVPIAIFTLGLVKKLVFADQIGEAVNTIYAQAGPSGPATLLAIYGFAVQIYCDFSGYTDMAIGLALMLGIRLPNNFLRPYASESLIDFWQRWHITLSYWLRDYLYIPLGGNRGSRVRQAGNVMITMVLGGLWHGANWTFVIWGMLHGIGVVFVQALKRDFPGHWLLRMPRWLGVFVTFHFVTLAWVFFRAESLGKALAMLAAPFAGGWENAYPVFAANVLPILLIVMFFGVHRYDDHRRIKAAVRYVRPEIVWPAILLGWIIAIALSQGSSAKFIYFDF
jgi:alginate O-acetyltransferase complex protein AlgI